MRKIGLFAAVATLVLVGVGAWAGSTSQARVDVVPGIRFDPAELMVNTKDLPEVEFVDYTFVYN
jgi:hypothetical protein